LKLKLVNIRSLGALRKTIPWPAGTILTRVRPLFKLLGKASPSPNSVPSASEILYHCVWLDVIWVPWISTRSYFHRLPLACINQQFRRKHTAPILLVWLVWDDLNNCSLKFAVGLDRCVGGGYTTVCIKRGVEDIDTESNSVAMMGLSRYWATLIYSHESRISNTNPLSVTPHKVPEPDFIVCGELDTSSAVQLIYSSPFIQFSLGSFDQGIVNAGSCSPPHAIFIIDHLWLPPLMNSWANQREKVGFMQEIIWCMRRIRILLLLQTAAC